MAGTRIGGIKAGITNKQRYGSDFYTNIGAIGGRKSTGGGFAANPELAREAGIRGGKASRRPVKNATHCINGHEFNEENTRTYLQDGHYRRACRACQRERMRVYMEERKRAAL